MNRYSYFIWNWQSIFQSNVEEAQLPLILSGIVSPSNCNHSQVCVVRLFELGGENLYQWLLVNNVLAMAESHAHDLKLTLCL